MITAEAIKTFFRDKYLSPRTIEQYQSVLNRLPEYVPVMPGTPDNIRDLLKTASTTWVKISWYNVLNIYYSWAHLQWGYPNIMELVGRPPMPEVEIESLSESDLATVLAMTKSDKEKVIVSLALDCGLRASEFGRLLIENIHPEYIWIVGKRQKKARIPITPDMHVLLEQWIKQLPSRKPDTLLFTTATGQPIDRWRIYRIVRRCMDRAGIVGTKKGPHILRHSLGMNYIRNGGDPFSLKRIMRHTNISTTNKYVNLNMETITEMHNRFSPLPHVIMGLQGSFDLKESVPD